MVYSISLKEHEEHLNKVLKKLTDGGLKLNESKCEFRIASDTE